MRGEWSHLAFTQRTLAAEVYLTLVGSIVGYSAYTYALKYLPVSTVSLYAYITPILAVILGALVMHERFTPRMAVAIAVIFAGMLVVRRHAGTSHS